MSDNFNNLFFRSTSSRSASSLLRDFSPRRRPSDDSQTEDDTEIRFQLPSKKFKLENSPTSKPFPKYENHLELIQSKAESAKLQNKINGLERELIELKTDFDKERDGLFRDKTKLESRINVLERELTFLSEKESEARKQLETLIKEKETENSFSNEKFKMLKEQKFRLETNLAEKTQEAECRLQTLWLELNKEKKACMEFRSAYEQTERELSLTKTRNTHLLDELKTYVERLSQKTKQCDREDNFLKEQAITMKQFREENQIATALRLDVAELKQLRQENSSFKQQIQRYQNLSENTSLLREQKNSLEENVKKLKRTVEKYANENNELKIVIAKNQSTNGSSQISFNEIDYLTKQCVDLKFELRTKQDKISSMERLLDENRELVTKLQEDLKMKEDKMELEMSRFSVETNEISVQTDNDSERLSTDGSDSEAKFLSLIEQKEEQIKHLMKKLGLELDFDPKQTKVVHFQMNPLDDAHSQHTNELQNLRQENSSLKLRVEELEKFRPSSSSTAAKFVDDDVTMNVQKKLDEQKSETIIEELRAEIVKLTQQRERVAKINKDIGTQFREMSYLLTGYQLKMKDSGLCVMQSVFETPERHFLFQKGPDGEVQLLDNEFAAEWRDFVETYLQTDHSIPAFLAAVTLQLFSKNRDASSITDT